MANASVPKPAKSLSRKRSFRLGLPLLCGQSDVASPGGAVGRSSSFSFSRRSSGTGTSTSSRQSELHRIFQHFDRDNDGKISSAELSAFFASMGDDMPMPSSSSGGGYVLDFAGFVALMERGEGSQEEDLRRAFEVFNAVESAGRITARGMQRVLAQLGRRLRGDDTGVRPVANLERKWRGRLKPVEASLLDPPLRTTSMATAASTSMSSRG